MQEKIVEAHNLFLLMFNLAQLTKKEKIIDIFLGAVKEIWPENEVVYQKNRPAEAEDCIEISIADSSFGWLSISRRNHLGTEDLDLMHNAAAMLAFILKKNEQDELLAHEKKHLEKLVDEKIETIKESNLKFQTIFENSMVGKSITTLDGNMTINKAFHQILGYSRDELSTVRWQQITHADDVERDEEIQGSIISGEKESARWEKRYIHKKGNIVWVDIATTLQLDSDGNPAYFITSIIDITEHKQAEEALVSSEELLRIILTNISDPVFITDDNGKFFYICPNVTSALGYTREEVEKMGNISKLLGDKLLNSEELRKQGEIVNREYSLHDASGIQRIFLINVKQITVRWGTILITLHEITDRKQAEQDLANYRDHLEDIVKERTAELEEKYAELERMNKLFVGREFRIKELREKIQELEGKL